MSRLAVSSLIALAALAVASEARAGLRCDAMGAGEQASTSVVAASPTPIAPTASPTPVRKPAAATPTKEGPPRAADARAGSSTPDWRALIPGSLR